MAGGIAEFTYAIFVLCTGFAGGTAILFLIAFSLFVKIFGDLSSAISGINAAITVVGATRL